jgi:Tol biopolymer transport system component
MKGRRGKLALGATAATLLAVLAVVGYSSAAWKLPAEYRSVQRLPKIRPDYSQIVIPPNIAPLNFRVEESGVEYRVRIHAAAGDAILIGSRKPTVIIPAGPWRQLLDKNRGGRIGVDVYAKGDDGRWSRFESIENEVAREEIDSHLVYRLIGPVCNEYRTVGIYQRNLEGYDESPILINSSFGGCVNCHTFLNHRPDRFSFQIRPQAGDKRIEPGTIDVRDGRAATLKTQSKAAPKRSSYLAWHPSGSVLAFSMSVTGQVFHGTGAEFRDAYDADSHLAVMNVRSGAVYTTPDIADPDKLENFPCWSADGKVLYYCRTKRLWPQKQSPTIEQIMKIKYDLMSIRYDVERGILSEPKTLLAAADTGLSICEPRTSPDGRYLLFCMLNYGAFPLFQSSGDLYLMELQSGKYRRLACNSQSSEAWHCWSSNSRWIVFSRRRDNPLMSRPYFSYLDAQGREHKPFLLPQKDPAFYDTFLKTYNVPELVSGPVTVTQEELLRPVTPGPAAQK